MKYQSFSLDKSFQRFKVTKISLTKIITKSNSLDQKMAKHEKLSMTLFETIFNLQHRGIRPFRVKLSGQICDKVPT